MGKKVNNDEGNPPTMAYKILYYGGMATLIGFALAMGVVVIMAMNGR